MSRWIFYFVLSVVLTVFSFGLIKLIAYLDDYVIGDVGGYLYANLFSPVFGFFVAWFFYFYNRVDGGPFDLKGLIFNSCFNPPVFLFFR